MKINCFKFTIVFWAVAITGMSMVTPGFGQDADALLQKVDFIRGPGSDFTFDLKIITSDGTEQELEVSILDTSKGLVRYVRPVKVAGRAILFVEQNMWIYVPGTRRALRISPQQRILGGVSNADVARTAYSADYKVNELIEIDGNIILILAPITQSSAYQRIDLMIKPSGSPVMATFLTKSGRKIKTMYFEGYRDVLGVTRPTKFRIIDHLNNDTLTTMIYSNYTVTKTPASWYQPSNLSRLR